MTANVRDALSAATRRQISVYQAAESYRIRLSCIGCLMGKPADNSALIPLDFSSGFVYNSHDNQIGQFVTILSVNKTRDLQPDGRICAHFVLLWARTAPIFLFLEESL